MKDLGLNEIPQLFIWLFGLRMHTKRQTGKVGNLCTCYSNLVTKLIGILCASQAATQIRENVAVHANLTFWQP